MLILFTKGVSAAGCKDGGSRGHSQTQGWPLPADVDQAHVPVQRFLVLATNHYFIFIQDTMQWGKPFLSASVSNTDGSVCLSA